MAHPLTLSLPALSLPLCLLDNMFFCPSCYLPSSEFSLDASCSQTFVCATPHRQTLIGDTNDQHVANPVTSVHATQPPGPLDTTSAPIGCHCMHHSRPEASPSVLPTWWYFSSVSFVWTCQLPGLRVSKWLRDQGSAYTIFHRSFNRTQKVFFFNPKSLHKSSSIP